MFRAGLLLIIKRINSVKTATGIVRRYVDWLLAGSGWNNITHDYTNCCLYGVDPPDDGQQACSKHVDDYY
jgi:hypothetical protein